MKAHITNPTQWFDFDEVYGGETGKWRGKQGYIYAIFFKCGTIKVGSSVNPRGRIKESWSWKNSGRVAFVPVPGNHRKLELAFHRQMRCVNWANGADAKNECYTIKTPALRSAITEWINGGAREERLGDVAKCARLEAVMVRDGVEENSEPCPCI